MKRTIRRISSKKMDTVLRVQTTMMKLIHDYMYERGVMQLMPVILSPITDPLNHDVSEASINHGDQKLQLTKSMILHKQISLLSESRKAIYIVSPNVRLEKTDSGRHLLEFSQVDFEFKDAERADIMRFTEDLMFYVLSSIKTLCTEELKYLDRKLPDVKRPFKIFESKDLEAEFGPDFEKIVSEREKEPFWILDHEREFYDREHPEKDGYFVNYDLVYPEGFGEAMSGGEREHDHSMILKGMERTGIDPATYEDYLHLSSSGLIPKSAGAGFGVERLVRFICGLEHIEEASLFPKIPGKRIKI